MTASKSKSNKSTEEGAAPDNGFYGLADHPNHGLIASILTRKSRKFEMTDQVKKMCKQVEAYKSCCDNLHQSIMYMLVENPETSKQLVNSIQTEPNYRYAAQYLLTYESIANKGSKGAYESLETVIKTLQLLDSEHEKRVKKHLEAVKPLTKFIGEDYWEYARLRKVYWESLEKYDEAITQQNKERTEQSEQVAANAQCWRNGCRQKLMDFIKKSIFEQKIKHAECVLKFRDEMISYHKAMADLIPFIDPKTETPKSINKPPK